MEQKNIKVKPQFLCNIAPFLKNKRIINISCDSNANLIILVASQDVDENLDIFNNRNEMLFDKKRGLEVIKITENSEYGPVITPLIKTGLRIEHFQPLKNNKWILSTNYSKRQTYGEKANSFVLNTDKKIEKFLCTGSEITGFQTTKDDLLWVAYDINGILGHNDISRKKLVCIDSKANLFFDFTNKMESEITQKYFEIEGCDMDFFESCDGLNITVDGDVWAYWYGGFDGDTLIKIKDFKFQEMHTNIPSYFYYNFAVFDDWILFSKFDDEFLHLYSLKETEECDIAVFDKNGNILEFEDCCARDKTTYLLSKGHCYKLELDDVLANI